MMTADVANFDAWLHEVREALKLINMPMDSWQRRWAFNFRWEFDLGTPAKAAALNVNRFWWYEQNKALGQHCRRTQLCWLPRNHSDDCQQL
jgi:hypothetical protein